MGRRDHLPTDALVGVHVLVVDDAAAAQGGAIPAIALTAHGAAHGPDRTLAAGFQAHWREPVDPWELCPAVAGLVRRA